MLSMDDLARQGSVVTEKHLLRFVPSDGKSGLTAVPWSPEKLVEEQQDA